MKPAREELLFELVLTKPLSERAAWLDRECENDPALRQRLEALLATEPENHGSVPLNADDAGARVEGGATELTPTLLDETPLTEGPGTLIGRYKLLEQIGEGGFGVVYVAEQQEPVRRQVALKIIKLGMDTRQVVARFEAERQALALMDHPAIAKVFDAGATDSGRPFFVMELVKGIPITHYCDQKKLATRDRLGLFIGVCQAIQHAHQKGIIHRDIKPSNILVTVHEGLPVPKVIDFGIAKATQQKLTEKTLHTQLQQFLGTPAYMSPEQAEMSGLDIDTRSDIYSLGVLLYELLVGRTPFDAKELLAAGLDEIRRAILEKEPARPSTRLSMMGKEELTTTTQHRAAEAPKLINLLRGDLDWIAMKCLEKDRTRRYETANGLAADLQRFLNDEPVVARPPSATYRLQKAWRRNRLAFSAAGLVILAMTVGLALAAAGWRQAQYERDQAQANEAEAKRNLYLANIGLVQQAWEQDNLERARQLLNETANYKERGFEWYYWQRQMHLESRLFRGHTSGETSLAFSPDGLRLVTGSWDGTARVWDVPTGNELFAMRHGGQVTSVAFSPDGRWIVTGAQDRLRMWNASSGRCLLTIDAPEGQTASSVAFSPDGRRILAGFGSGTRVWDATTAKLLLKLGGKGDKVTAAAFSPDGKRILTAGADAVGRVWDAASGEPLFTLVGHADAVLCAAFSPDGLWIVTGSADQTAKVWDASTGKEAITLPGHRLAIDSVAFSSDGRRVVTGGADQTARLWDAANGRELQVFKGHPAEVGAVAFSPDGRWVATGSGDWLSKRDNTVRLWEVTDRNSPLTLTGHTNDVTSVDFSPDGQHVVTGARDQTARVWDLANGHELLTLVGRRWSDASFSPDGHRIVTSTGPSTAQVWDATTGKTLFALEGHGTDARRVAYSADGRRIGMAYGSGTFCLWDAVNGRHLLELKVPGGTLLSFAFSPDGKRIVTGSFDALARVYDTATGGELLELRDHDLWVSSVAYSPDGKRLLTGSGDRTAKVWDASTGKPIRTLIGHGDQVSGVAFSPDGKRIVTGSLDRNAKVWDAATGKELLTLTGHRNYVNAVAFSPDGRRIVTGSWDKTAKIWEAATPQQVAAWEAEEKRAEQRLAARQQEDAVDAKREEARRRQDPGCIKQWLVLAPFPFPGSSEQALADALDREQIPNEASLRPSAGQRVTVDGEERTWQALELPDYVLDFNKVVGNQTDWSLAYAVCYVMSDAAQTGVCIEIGSDDGAQVYLNGNRIYRGPRLGPYFADQKVVGNQELKAGLNVLVFKVANGTLDWKGSIRFTDVAGNPVKGLRVTLQP